MACAAGFAVLLCSKKDKYIILGGINMKCPNCGEEITGKFCTKCGTPAPTQTEPVQQPEQPVQYQPQEPVQQPEPAQYRPQEPVQQPEPAQYQPQDSFQQPEQPQYPPRGGQQYGGNSTSYGQQFTNNAGKQFTSNQQFSNQNAVNSNPNGKKPMSSGKIVAIVLGIVGGVIVLLGIIITILVINVFNTAGKFAGKMVSNAASSISSNTESGSFDVNKLLSDLSSELSSELDGVLDATGDSSSSSGNTSNTVADNLKTDPSSGFVYREGEDGIVIVDWEPDYENDPEKLDIKIPSKIDGKPVVEIKDGYIFDAGKDSYITVYIPGSVKKIDEYAFAFSEYIDEIVIEDGVKEIDERAFYDHKSIKKATVPASVTEMGDCDFGIVEGDDGEEKVNPDFVMIVAKGSAAENYCKENGVKCEAK